MADTKLEGNYIDSPSVNKIITRALVSTMIDGETHSITTAEQVLEMP